MFDLFFRPFRAADPIYGFAAVSFLTGLTMVFVFRYASNQKAIRLHKNRIQAHLLEVRLFQDQLGVVLRAYPQILRWTLGYMVHSMRPLAVMLLPMAFLLVQLDLRFSHIAPRPRDSLLLKAHLAQSGALDQVSLRLPEGLTLTAPPLHIPAENEVDWRIRAEKSGEFAPEVVVSGQAFPKQIIVSNDITRLSPERVRAGFLERFLYSGEPLLPANGPLKTLEVNYRPREINLWLFRTNWLIAFLVISLVSGFALKSLLGIEF